MDIIERDKVMDDVGKMMKDRTYEELSREEKSLFRCPCHANINRAYIPMEGEDCYAICLHNYNSGPVEGDIFIANVKDGVTVVVGSDTYRYRMSDFIYMPLSIGSDLITSLRDNILKEIAIFQEYVSTAWIKERRRSRVAE